MLLHNLPFRVPIYNYNLDRGHGIRQTLNSSPEDIENHRRLKLSVLTLFDQIRKQIPITFGSGENGKTVRKTNTEQKQILIPPKIG